MDLFYKDDVILVDCFHAPFVLQAFQIDAVDLSGLAENFLSGEICLSVTVSTNSKLYTKPGKESLVTDLQPIYEQFHTQLANQTEGQYILVMDYLEMCEAFNFWEWIAQELTKKEKQAAITSAVYEHFFDSAVTQLPDRCVDVLSGSDVEDSFQIIRQELQKVGEKKNELLFYQAASSDIGLMFILGAIILGAQAFLWHQLAETLITVQCFKNFNDFFWAFGVSALFFCVLILVLIVPLFFVLRSGIHDLIKWLRILIKYKGNFKKK